MLTGAAGTIGGALKAEPELAFTLPSKVVIEAVVTTKGNGSVLDGNGTTEEFNAVIEVSKNFYVIDFRAGTDTAEG